VRAENYGPVKHYWTWLNSSFPNIPHVGLGVQGISSACLVGFSLGLMLPYPPRSWGLFTYLDPSGDTEILAALLPMSLPKASGTYIYH